MRKGFFKSLLSMLLVFIISTNVEMISYGQTRGLSAIKPDSCAAGTVQFVDQELLYDSLLNDETVKSVLRQGNRLFYTTSSGLC